MHAPLGLALGERKQSSHINLNMAQLAAHNVGNCAAFNPACCPLDHNVTTPLPQIHAELGL